MGWLEKLRGREVPLAPEARARFERWRALSEPDLNSAPADTRVVVVDVESTGLDTRVDRLIAIGAVSVQGHRIDLGHSFYAVLRQRETSTTANILVHGIGGTEQREGADPVEALLAFLEFAGKAPLAGYHAAFDNAMIRRAMAEHLGVGFKRPWIDLAYVAPDLVPEENKRNARLDTWLEAFGIEVFSRHDAVADALATAQLWLAVLARAGPNVPARIGTMLWDPNATRWLGRER